MSSPLRNLPTVGELLESPPLKSLVNRVSRNVVVTKVGQFLDQLRGQVQGATGVNVPSPTELADRIARWIAAGERPGIAPVINATGILLHDELGGPPLADEAIRAILELTGGYASVDFDLAAGHAVDRNQACSRLLARLTGAEAAAIVNTSVAARLVGLAALAAGREVIVSRGQISDCGGLPLPDVAREAGCTLREVGTTNRTTPEQYAAAIGERTAALMHVNSGSYALVGDAIETSLPELAALGRRHNLPVIDDLPAGTLCDLTKFGLSQQPLAPASIQAGADLVILAGERLGGPACGILCGKPALIERIVKHPLMPALRASPLVHVALAATLKLYEDPALAERSIPLLSLLATPLANLRNRAERLAPQIAATGVAKAEIVSGETSLAGDDVPGQRLPTVQLVLSPTTGTAGALAAGALAAALRGGVPAVVARVANDSVVLDLRSVQPRSDVALATAFEALRKEPASASPAVAAD
jgi:L-seryl-tRNA(Ser) seleniumtransferase